MDVEHLKEQSFHGILDHGHLVMVCPAYDLVPAPYAYTVGRTMLGRPEILVTGIERDNAGLLNQLAAYDDQRPLTAGMVATVEGVAFKMIAANPAPCHTAVLTFGKVDVLQALMPDAQGRYPDSLPGRDSRQPVLPIEGTFGTYDPYDEEDE